MSRNPDCTVFIGNLDEKVSERVLYEILIQVGRVVDLHIPRDKETNRHKGYAFAEYESEEIAQYAVSLFSGLVRLNNRTLRFAISGQDKPSSNGNTSVAPKPNSPPLFRSPHVPASGTNISREPARSTVNGRIIGVASSASYSHGVRSQASSGGIVSRGLQNGTYEYSRRVFGSVLNDVNHRPGRQPISYSPY